MFNVSARYAKVGERITSDGYQRRGAVHWEVLDFTNSHIKLVRIQQGNRGLIPVNVTWETVDHMHIVGRGATASEVVVCSSDYMSSDKLTDEDKAIITEKLQ